MKPSSSARMTVPVAPSPFHHGSHRGLLTTGGALDAGSATVDAIIVPTARRTASLRQAAALAQQLNCPLVALCSKWADVGETAKLAADQGVELIAVDVNKYLPARLMPTFDTTDLLVGTKFERRTDTSLKRNLGLLLATVMGWQRIVFLDDDITVREPDHLRAAVRMLDSHAGVGLSIGGFPDNSVVCHAFREGGGAQSTFIGGGALAVRVDSSTSFFPNIYNEDWFFLLTDSGLRPSAVTGTAEQSPYDPFANDQRARSEEFGDCLAEGVFGLLDQGRPVAEANARYWTEFLANRRLFIDEVIERVPLIEDRTSAEKARMLSALKAARGRSILITPQQCVDYLDAWRLDRERWRSHVAHRALPGKRKRQAVGLSAADALFRLGLTEFSKYVPLQCLDQDVAGLR